MSEPRVQERHALEVSFIRARWLAAGILAIVLPISDLGVARTALLVGLVVAGNALVWFFTARVETLGGQRRTGVGAVTLDALVALGAGIAGTEDVASAAFAGLVVVVAEASVRYAPPKALLATAVMIVALAAAMLLRHALADDPFSLAEFGVIGLLALLVGTIVGSAVREVYRSRVATSGTSTQTPTVPGDIEEQLTPRERQVLQLIVRGYSNSQIADALVIEPKTVKNHINRIYGKLDLNNRYEAITSVLGQRREET